MSAITTHVLDTALGRPARGVPVLLELRAPGGDFRELGRGLTDDDGRCRTLLAAEHVLQAGAYRITFDTAAYFAGLATEAFFPSVSVAFELKTPVGHYHVPLLLSPFGYSTYRGS